MDFGDEGEDVGRGDVLFFLLDLLHLSDLRGKSEGEQAADEDTAETIQTPCCGSGLDHGRYRSVLSCPGAGVAAYQT
ncbi:MAG: hypothetical protein CMJ83_04110 [Planctomycetes bacterium]|nr:hypothetical protein [Planctomycetota bacterium]